MPGRSREHRVVGFVSSLTADTLIVNGIAIVAEPTTIIRHGWRVLTLADIVVGDHVQARGRLTDGTLTATEIKVQPTGRDDSGETEISGVIANITPVSACPAIAFDLGTTRVVTTVQTAYVGTTCATLANALLVEVDGFVQRDGSILATRIAID